jgi:hypothetical protein
MAALEPKNVTVEPYDLSAYQLLCHNAPRVAPPYFVLSAPMIRA